MAGCFNGPPVHRHIHGFFLVRQVVNVQHCWWLSWGHLHMSTVRSGAEERTFWGARLDVLIFRLHSYHVLISYSAEWNGPKFYKTLNVLGQAGMFLSFQARRSSATRSSTSDLTVGRNILGSEFIYKSHRQSQALGKLCTQIVPSDAINQLHLRAAVHHQFYGQFQ